MVPLFDWCLFEKAYFMVFAVFYNCWLWEAKSWIEGFLAADNDPVVPIIELLRRSLPCYFYQHHPQERTLDDPLVVVDERVLLHH